VAVENIYRKQFPSETTEQAASFAHQLFEPFIEAPVAALQVWLRSHLASLPPTRFTRRPTKIHCRKTRRALARHAQSFYFDELYEATVIRLHNTLAAIAGGIDWCIENVFIGFIRGGTDFAGRGLRLVQTGNLQTYAFLFALGAALVLYLVLGK